MNAIRIEQFGGSSVLRYTSVELPPLAADQVLVRHEAIGVNFLDVYQREGRMSLALPFTPGNEGAGVVEAIGAEVREFAPGDRVAYCLQLGSYADYAAVPATRLLRLPDKITPQQAATVLLQGMTAHYLTHQTYPIQADDLVLIHAGAGGVGLLLTQLAKRRGARVITTVSTDEKAALSRAAGADHVIVYTKEDFEPVVKAIAKGRGLPVVYDSVGRDTFERSLNCLQPQGILVLVGSASGSVPPFDLQQLAPRGSLFVTRPTLAHYVADRASLLQRANDVFGWVADGSLTLHLAHPYPLRAAAQAHDDLEARRTAGKVLFLPDS